MLCFLSLSSTWKPRYQGGDAAHGWHWREISPISREAHRAWHRWSPLLLCWISVCNHSFRAADGPNPIMGTERSCRGREGGFWGCRDMESLRWSPEDWDRGDSVVAREKPRIHQGNLAEMAARHETRAAEVAVRCWCQAGRDLHEEEDPCQNTPSRRGSVGNETEREMEVIKEPGVSWWSRNHGRKQTQIEDPWARSEQETRCETL